MCIPEAITLGKPIVECFEFCLMISSHVVLCGLDHGTHSSHTNKQKNKNKHKQTNNLISNQIAKSLNPTTRHVVQYLCSILCVSYSNVLLVEHIL